MTNVTPFGTNRTAGSPVLLTTIYTGALSLRAKGEDMMPMFIDVHEALPDGAGFDDVASAHAADVAAQGAYGVNYKAYWVDETQGKAFCLVEAPNAEAAIAVHREAHGLVADRIFEVREGA